MIFESDALPDYKSQISEATSFGEIATVIKTLFAVPPDKVPGQDPPKDPNDYKNDNSDYGLKVKGIKAREKLNEQAREIIERVKDPGDLTDKDREVLKQYSGRGGLTDNSQFEYYTPTYVAEGLWDGLKAHGFANGNVLDPCTGAGVFSATKPKGVLVTGADIDQVGSRVAQLLNPEDSIKNQAFEKTVIETPDNTFDAVVGNVPFGSARGASAHTDPAYKTEKRIERYFILRALDKVRPGGLCCLVVPINIVGAKGGQWEKFRIACSKKAEFLGAHKLPSKTFGVQGTDTVVDVVVFKKHPEDFLESIETIPFETLKSANVVWDEFISGKYWLGEGRKFIMGKYMPKVEGDRWSRETVDGDVDNAGLKARLAQRFNSRIDWDALAVAEPIVRNYIDGDRKMINGAEYEMQNGMWVRVIQENSSITVDAQKYGAATIEELKGRLSNPNQTLGLSADQVFAAYKSFPELLSPLQKASIEFAMSQPKTEYQEQIFRGSVIGGMIARYQNSVNDGTAEDADRLELQELVVKEIDRFGHPKNNKGLMLIGESSKMFGLFKGAVDEKGQFTDLLAGTLEGSGRTLEYDSTNLQAIVEHLFIREGIKTLELEDIQKLYSGKREIHSLADLADEDAIAITPDGMIEPMSRYSAGDIYPKIDALRQAIGEETDERLKGKFLKQIEAIMRRRKTTKPEDIVFGMRQRWINRKYIVDFLRENGYPALSYGTVGTVTEENPFDGTMQEKTKFVQDFDNPFGAFIGIDDKGGFNKQFLKYLNGENVTSSGEDAQERIAEYKSRCASLEERFNVWLQQHTDIGILEDQYNRRFNGYTPFEYEDTELGIKGVSPQIKLHGYQNSAVRRLSEEGSGILAHNVGLGKTFSALALHAYNQQLGRTKKTCIVVPKSVLANWYHESKTYLGKHDGVLIVGYEPKTDKKTGAILQETVKDEKGQTKINKFTGKPMYQDQLLKRDSKEDTWEAMWKIPTSNYSLVIMTKDKFGQIPLRPETKQTYTDAMVNRSLLSEKAQKKALEGDTKVKGKSYAEDVNEIRNQQRFSDEGTAKKGELPYFEDMGFTDVIVDECFVYDTEIVTRAGIMKIGDICENMIQTDVLSRDLGTGELVWKPIVRWLPKRLFVPLIKVTLENGSHFICTESHKIWTEEEGYVEAGNLRGRHSLQALREYFPSEAVQRAENGGLECVRVVGIEVLEPGDYVRLGLGDPSGQTVYDLEVADTHNYFANSVLVSNCHEFKNSQLGGEHYQRVAYLPAADTAQRAIDMNLKMSHIRDRNNGRGTYMMSATPVTNSPFEIFNMLSFVCPVEEFEKYGIYTPDDFIRVFGEIKSIDKMKVGGAVASVDGLTGFQNLDGLRSMFHKFVNMKSAKDFPDQIKLPPSEEITLDVELTDEQKEVYSDLRDRAKDAAKPGNKGESMFTIIREMDRVSTDMDLYHKTMTFVFRLGDKAKVDAMIGGLPKSIKIRRIPNAEENESLGLEGDEKGKAREFVVALKTTSQVKNDSYVVVFPEEFENTVVDHMADAGISLSDVSHPLTPKYGKLIENLRKDLEVNGKQLIFTEEKSQHQKILRLVVHHIPTIANLIGIINADEADGDALQKISDSYNAGGLKFVICNKKAEVGVNLQKGTTAIHHLTLPWTPASIQQRNGRGVRQGNTAANIAIYYYCGKGSFDSYRLDVLKAKSNWMQDLFEGGDATAENANAMSQDEMLDMLEADPEAAKARRLERLAAKKAEDEAKEKKRLANQLQVLAHAASELAKLDEKKVKEKTRLEEDIPKLEEEIKTLKERGLALDEDDPSRLLLGTKIIRAQRKLADSKTGLAGLDEKYGKKRTQLDSTIKQTAGLLKQKAKKGVLPFDEALIDNPGKACVSLTGKVVAAGDCYELRADGGWYRGLFRITDVNPEIRAFKYENVVGSLGAYNLTQTSAVGNYYGWFDVSSIEDMEKKGLKKVSYSEKEIDLKKALAQKYKYEDLIAGKLDKETFLDHRMEIGLDNYSHYIVRDENGKIAFRNIGNYNHQASKLAEAIVYPDPANEEFKKGVCEAYLARKREGGKSGVYGLMNIVVSMYGADFEETAMAYGKKAVESEILPVCAKAWNDTLKRHLGGKSIDEAAADFAESYPDEISAQRRIRGIVDDASYTAKAEAVELGDNRDEISGMVINDFAGIMDTFIRAYKAQKADKERAADEALKKDPRYREVPKEIEAAFLRLGITVKTNKTNMSIPGFKGRAGTGHEPFSKWFFQDRAGKYGMLYKVKEIIKARFGAKFFSGAGGEFIGAWWYVSITTDLKEIYELMA